MRRTAVLIVLLVLLAASVQDASASSRIQEFVDQAQEATVRIFTNPEDEDDEPELYGGGVLITLADGSLGIMTVHHVIEESEDRWLIGLFEDFDPNKKEEIEREDLYPARVQHTHSFRDIALLVFVDTEEKSSPETGTALNPSRDFCAGEPTIFEEVFHIGHPVSEPFMAMKGDVGKVGTSAVSMRVGHGTARRRFMVDMNVNHGSSGGGVFALESGCLYAVVSTGTGGGYAGTVPAQEFCDEFPSVDCD